MTYLSVVSRDSVQIALIIAVLNDLDVLACDIHNVYITVDCRYQVWVVAGTKLLSEAGNNMLVRKALYILKSSGAAFRAFLSENMDAKGYWPIYANPDL